MDFFIRSLCRFVQSIADIFSIFLSAIKGLTSKKENKNNVNLLKESLKPENKEKWIYIIIALIIFIIGGLIIVFVS